MAQDKKVALVTGASSGIGEATVQRLMKDGYVVYAAARRIERMKQLEADGAKLLKMDVTDEESMVSGVDRIIEEQGQIDVLVNNAGYGEYGAIEDTPIEDARHQLDVNLFGVARLTQLALPNMRSRRSGTIVNMSSMGGKVYTLMGGWYHAAKHALEGWSDCLRLEVEQFGIDVVIIEPGQIDTAWGVIAADRLLENSKDSAYAGMACKVAASMKANYSPGKGSPPSVVADAISKALRSSHPKTRYAVGRYAKLMIGMGRWIPNRTFDRFITRMTIGSTR